VDSVSTIQRVCTWSIYVKCEKKTLPKIWGQNHKNNIFKLFAIYAELGDIITTNMNMCEEGRSIQSGRNILCVFFYETVNSISFYNCAR